MLNQRVCLPYGKIPQIPAILNSPPGLPSRQIGFARGRPRFAPLTVQRYSALSPRARGISIPLTVNARLLWGRDCRVIVVLQVLLLNLISFQKNATRRAVGESRAEVFSLKKNKTTYCFLSGPRVFPCCFLTFWRITAQLKCTVFYGPISMKERFQFRLYNPQIVKRTRITTSFPGSLFFSSPGARERERPWPGLVTCLYDN